MSNLVKWEWGIGPFPFLRTFRLDCQSESYALWKVGAEYDQSGVALKKTTAEHLAAGILLIFLYLSVCGKANYIRVYLSFVKIISPPFASNMYFQPELCCLLWCAFYLKKKKNINKCTKKSVCLSVRRSSPSSRVYLIQFPEFTSKPFLQKFWFESQFYANNKYFNLLFVIFLWTKVVDILGYLLASYLERSISHLMHFPGCYQAFCCGRFTWLSSETHDHLNVSFLLQIHGKKRIDAPNFAVIS